MIISLDTQLDTIDLELDDLRSLNADEMKAEILKAFPEGLDEDELEALKQEILDELDELKDEWKDVLSGEKSEMADAETPRDKAEHELNIEEIEEALDVLSPFEDSLDLAVDEASKTLDHEKLLNVETAENLSWTSAGLTEGDEVTMKCTGIAAGSGSIWGDEIQSDELTDVNGDGVVTYADYEAQNLTATGTDLESVQSITLGTAGETYALASVGDGTITFRVTDAQGQSFLLTIEGSPVFYFSPGVVSLDQVESWPETLANRCYEMGDTMSFGNHLYANSLSDEDKLAYVETYEEVVGDANFDAVWGVFYGSVVGYGDDMPRSELRPLYEESLKILYKYVNDPSSYSSMSAAWADVFQLWDNMGLSANDKRMVAEAMVLGVFQKGGEYFFQAFFQPVATILQNVIFAAGEAAGTNSNAFDKMIQILLFTHAGGDATFLSGKMATLDEETAGRYQSGAWGNHEENIEALELYQSLCANSGWALADGATTTAIANEKAMIEQDATDAEESADPMKKGIQISYDEMNSLITKWNKICEAGLFSSSTADDTAKSIFAFMFNDGDGDGESDGPVPADDLRRFIIDAINNYSVADQQDDMISIFMWTLHEQEPEVFNTLLEDASFKSTIYDAIQYDQWFDPYAADYLLEYLS